MNPRIFVGAAAGAMAAIIIGILVTGPAMVADNAPLVPGMQQGDGSSNTALILPLQVSLEDIAVEKITDRAATIEISFSVHNPNQRSVIVQTLDYRLFETAHTGGDVIPVSGGQIGTRPGGMVEFGSSYYTLLAGGTIILRDTVSLQNQGSPGLWDALQGGTASWRVTGDVFYNLSSMTSGQENVLSFEFVR
ncbi:MAG: hypothetical protein OXP12_06965 [Thaumarchaeota archaeon]|nr:hypothetical protein [Nitrososphaerota archaeon]MDE0266248.1 hypothetical protein [Nitrososphaerota archaeon]MDE0527040.1 hypothetical protein [Nitrososphaerota archaeon]